MIKTLLLILILLLAFFMAIIPHIGYAYPLHLDEWLHMAHSKALIEAGTITYPNPLSGQIITGPGIYMEVNFRLLWAMLQQVSGIDWLVLFRFGPSLVFMLTVLSVYVLCRKEGYGLEAAFFTCLIPTTVGLMGAAFMVPVALGLAFIPLSLFIAFRVKSWPAYLLLAIIACFLWLLHPPSATVLYIVIAPYILINLKGNWRHSVALSTALLVPLLIALSWMWLRLLPALGKLQVTQVIPANVEIPALLEMYGVLPLALCFTGVIYLARKGSRNSYGLIIGLALLLFAGLVLLWFQYGMFILYARGLHTVLLLISVMAGVGLLWVRLIRPPAGGLLCCLLIGLILAMSVPARVVTPYYHMIEDEDYRAFTWIKENVELDDYPAMVTPWQGSAFTAITGMNVLRYIGSSQEQADELVSSYLASGCPDTSFLQENRVAVVYTQLPCDNHDLLQVKENVYVTAGSITNSSAATTTLQNGGFDAVTPAPLSGWARSSANIMPDYLFPEPGRTGGSSASIKMSAAAPYKPWPVARWYQKVAVQPGTTYAMGGWIKTDNITGDGGARLAIQWRNTNTKILKTPDLMAYTKGTVDWTYYEYKVNAPSDAAACYILLEMAGCSGTAWFDDSSFKVE